MKGDPCQPYCSQPPGGALQPAVRVSELTDLEQVDVTHLHMSVQTSERAASPSGTSATSEVIWRNRGVGTKTLPAFGS